MEELFGEILVPEAVWKEITVEGKPGYEKVVRAEFVSSEKVGGTRLVALLEEFIDRGRRRQ